MEFSTVIVLFFMAFIGIGAIAYFIADAITSHCDGKLNNDIATAKIDLATMENDLQQLQSNLLAAKRALTIAEVKQDPNAIIIGYNDKPRKARRSPHIITQ